MCFVYILRSTKSQRNYIGHTEDIEKRLERHNSGYVKSTRNKGPWECIYIEEYPTKLEANRRELEIKKQKSRKYIEYLISSTKSKKT